MHGENGRTGAAAAGKFLLGITALFLLFNFLLSLFPLEWFEEFYASAALFALGFFGIGGAVAADAEPVLLLLDAFTAPIAITWLCTGLLELTIVWSAVLSTFEVDSRKRAVGIAAATVALTGFNIARIAASVLIIHWFGLGAGVFGHDFLFRVFLFAAVAGIYYFWLRWASGAGTPEK